MANSYSERQRKIPLSPKMKLSIILGAVLLLLLLLYFGIQYQKSKLKVPERELLGLFAAEVPEGFDTDKDGFPDKQENQAGSDASDPRSLPTDRGNYNPLSQVDVNEDGDFDITVTQPSNGISSVIIEHYGDFQSVGAGYGEVNIANYGNVQKKLPDNPIAEDAFDINELAGSGSDKVIKYIHANSYDVVLVSVIPVSTTETNQ